MISSGEAFSLLKDWKAAKASMRFMLAFRCGGGSFRGYIGEVEGATVRLIGEYKRADFMLALPGARFRREGPGRVPPADLPEDAETEYIDCLTVEAKTGEVVRFFKLRG